MLEESSGIRFRLKRMSRVFCVCLLTREFQCSFPVLWTLLLIRKGFCIVSFFSFCLSLSFLSFFLLLSLSLPSFPSFPFLFSFPCRLPCLSCLCSLFLSGVRQDWCGHHNRFLFRAEGHTVVPFFFLLLSSYNPVSMWKPRMEGKLNFLWVQGDVTASLDSFTSWGKKKRLNVPLTPKRTYREHFINEPLSIWIRLSEVHFEIRVTLGFRKTSQKGEVSIALFSFILQNRAKTFSNHD